MSTRVCALCGAPLPLQHGRGGRRKMCEHCSPPRRRGPAVALALAPSEPTSAPDGSPPDSVTAATVAELVSLGQADTPNGRLAVVVARRIDSGQEPGGALAQLAKSHRECMALAYAAANAQTDYEQPNLLEQIRLMREKRLAEADPVERAKRDLGVT